MRKETCCGCIIVEDRKVLLVQEKQGHWGLPKGHVEGNETHEETAIREVKEETNLDVEINSSKVFEISYIIDDIDEDIDKTVYFYPAKVIKGDAERQESEINEIKWVPVENAVSQLTYDNVKVMLENALKELGYIQ
ncbi:MAG: NUDIX domain-containing protein [Clostridia bacterium]|nr:NUDIX domain-containing protein [Clostridia bacterium]